VNDNLRGEIEALLDQAASRHPDGVKSEELRAEVLDDVIGLLLHQERDLNAEADALLMSVSRQSRKVRRSRMANSIEYLLDAFVSDEDAAYVDPMLSLAFPLGTDDGQVKTLRYWTAEDFDTSTRMAYRNASDVTAAAREHDERMQAAVRSMRLRGVSRFGGDE
jgi:hypothetical protein